jgi:hypothetical protein
VSEKGSGQTPMAPEPSDEPEPTLLAEVRAARALAASLEHRETAAKSLEDEVLRAAAQVGAARAPVLSEDARQRVASELFERPAGSRRRWGWAVGLAGVIAFGVVGTTSGLVLRSARMAPSPAAVEAPRELVEAQEMRDEARALVASLLASGRSPAERARAIAAAAEARAKTRGEEQR